MISCGSRLLRVDWSDPSQNETCFHTFESVHLLTYRVVQLFHTNNKYIRGSRGNLKTFKNTLDRKATSGATSLVEAHFLVLQAAYVVYMSLLYLQSWTFTLTDHRNSSPPIRNAHNTAGSNAWRLCLVACSNSIRLKPLLPWIVWPGDQPKKLKKLKNHVAGAMPNPATEKIGNCSTQLCENAKVAVVGRQASTSDSKSNLVKYLGKDISMKRGQRFLHTKPYLIDKDLHDYWPWLKIKIKRGWKNQWYYVTFSIGLKSCWSTIDAWWVPVCSISYSPLRATPIGNWAPLSCQATCRATLVLHRHLHSYSQCCWCNKPRATWRSLHQTIPVSSSPQKVSQKVNIPSMLKLLSLNSDKARSFSFGCVCKLVVTPVPLCWKSTIFPHMNHSAYLWSAWKRYTQVLGGNWLAVKEQALESTSKNFEAATSTVWRDWSVSRWCTFQPSLLQQTQSSCRYPRRREPGEGPRDGADEGRCEAGRWTSPQW